MAKAPTAFELKEKNHSLARKSGIFSDLSEHLLQTPTALDLNEKIIRWQKNQAFSAI